MDKIKLLKSWIISNKVEFLILLGILIVGAFCKLYRISDYMTFLGDEGRDVITVRRLLVEHHPPLIGPGTSIGNMYLGPAYYYMMAIPLLLSNYDPVGPAIFIALLGLITIWFVYYVVREWFPIEEETKRINWGALAAAFLYAISPVVIIYSRSSWNPNIMPFFALLTIYAVWKLWVRKNMKWLVVAAVSFAAVMQSHYLGLLLAPTIFILWFLTLIKFEKKKRFILFSILSLVIFLIFMSPLAIFDIRHNFINFKAMEAFFTNRETTVSVLPWKALPGMWPILTMITGDIVGSKSMSLGVVVGVLILAAFGYVYFWKRTKYDFRDLSVKLTLTLWLGFALIGLALYKQHIYDHYFGFVFVVPFIVLGGIMNKLDETRKKVFYVIGVILVIGIAFVDLQNSPLRAAPNMQLTRAKVVSRKVEEIANGEKFNFALIADNNYDSAYRYFLNLDGAKVTDIDPQNTKDTITSQLIVVCEREKSKCDPTHNPKAEVANFGWSVIENTYDNVFGVTIYKLGHTK